jgi:probable rRNA maturation factor
MGKPLSNHSSSIAVQIARGIGVVPRAAALRRWARVACAAVEADGQLCLRLVGNAEMAALNQRFRHREGATNVLSFEGDVQPDGCSRLLGDVVICAPLVRREAAEQGKREADHFAHLVVHGILHLCGYDHVAARDARVMERREIAILAELGVADPYRRSSMSFVHE